MKHERDCHLGQNGTGRELRLKGNCFSGLGLAPKNHTRIIMLDISKIYLTYMARSLRPTELHGKKLIECKQVITGKWIVFVLRHVRLEYAGVRVDSDEELLRPEARLQDGHRQDSR
jgi:hypothetical protein